MVCPFLVRLNLSPPAICRSVLVRLRCSCLRTWPPGAVRGGCKILGRVRLVGFRIVRIIGGVLARGGIPGAGLRHLRASGGHFRVVFHTLRRGRHGLSLMLSSLSGSASWPNGAGRGLPYG